MRQFALMAGIIGLVACSQASSGPSYEESRAGFDAIARAPRGQSSVEEDDPIRWRERKMLWLSAISPQHPEYEPGIREVAERAVQQRQPRPRGASAERALREELERARREIERRHLAVLENRARQEADSAAEQAAALRCRVQAMQASAGTPSIVYSEILRQQTYNLCAQAFIAERRATIATREQERATARQAEMSREDARRRAESDCRGARNQAACVRGLLSSAAP